MKKEENAEIEELKQDVEIPMYTCFFFNFIAFLLPLYPALSLFFLYSPLMNLILVDSSLFGINNFWLYFFFPLVIISAVSIYVVGVVIVSNWFIVYLNKKSPPVTGVFSRKYPVSSSIQYYHYRGFIIKYPMWLAYKSPVPGPWAMNWVLRKLGHNKIDKTVIYIDAFPGLEFSYIEENAVFYPGSILSTHLVDSIFGNLSILENRIAKESVFLPGSGMAPGGVFQEKYVLMPNSLCHKNWHGKKGKRFYSGSPAKSIDDVFNGIFSVLPPEVENVYNRKGYISGQKIDAYRKIR
ncbi:MAG: hypothetical protein ACTSWY_16010 [Promethearchaeota archaeon]